MTVTNFGRYQVLGEIGDGAMGRVYRGFDPLFGRTVAIKTIKSEYLTHDTPAYMAPEQVRGEEVTFRADLFSFAVVAYETLTGRRPFEGDTVGTILYKVVHEPVAAPRLWRPDLPEAYDAVFARALAKAPERRFSSARAFVAALRGEGAPEVLLPPEDPRRPVLSAVETQPVQATRARARRDAWLIGAAAVLLAGAVAALFQELKSKDASEAPTPGTLRIETSPPGATVWLDGAMVGRSPLELGNLRPGPRHLRILEDAYAPAELGLDLAEGMAAPTLRFVMSPTTAPLAVRSEPAGATVRVDGRMMGTTPLERVFLQPGRHELRVERPGFRTQARGIEARAGQPLLVVVRLKPRAGPDPAKAVARLAPSRPSASPPYPPPAEGALVDIDESVTPPARISGGPAPYPEKARKLKLRGSVLVGMIVTEKGEPTEIRVLESAGALLDEAVVGAVRTWRFEPARKRGVKVRVHWQHRQTFQLGR